MLRNRKSGYSLKLRKKPKLDSAAGFLWMTDFLLFRDNPNPKRAQMQRDDKNVEKPNKKLSLSPFLTDINKLYMNRYSNTIYCGFFTLHILTVRLFSAQACT